MSAVRTAFATEAQWRDRFRLAFDGLDVLLLLAWWSACALVLHALGIRIGYDPLNPATLWQKPLWGAGIGLPFARRALFGAPMATVRRRASLLGIVGLLLLTLGFMTALAGGWCVLRRPDPPPAQAQLDAECDKAGDAFEIYAVTGDPRVDAASKARADAQARQLCLDGAHQTYAAYLQGFGRIHVIGLYVLLSGTLVVAFGCLLDRVRMRREQRAA